MICIDSTLLVDFLNNRPEAITIVKKFIDKDLSTTSVNIFETVFGIYKKGNSNNKKEVEHFENLMENLTVLYLDYKASVLAAQIANDLIKRGREVQSHDCLIAGIMLSNGCDRIITRDTDHFKRIKWIKVERY